MDKLRIGIFQEPHLDKKTGGGYAFYHTVQQAIDRYLFHESLDIRFIHIGQAKLQPTEKITICIDPFKNIKKGVRYRRTFNHRVIEPAKRLFASLESLYDEYQVLFQEALQKSLEEELAKQRIDLVYYLHPHPHKLNYPYICTHWDNGHKSMFAFPEVTMNNNYEEREEYSRSVLGKAFAVFCESEAGRKELLHYMPINEERVFVVPLFPGQVVQQIVSTATQNLHLKKYRVTKNEFFFYPAQFWSHKNHYNLILAFDLLQQSHPTLKLLFTGSDKGNQAYIKEVVAGLGLEKKVLMPGFVTNEEVYSFYKNALALVMPTFLGPSNMPLLEAEALGCPVICTDLPGHREMLGERAYYIQPDDPQSICRGLEEHLQTRQSMPRVNPIFNLENAVKHIETNFLQLKARRKTFGYQYNVF